MAKRKAPATVRNPLTAKTPCTYADWLAWEHHEWQLHHGEDCIPTDLTYHFVVGEEVRFGGWEARVEEVLDGGVRLHISYQDTGKRYGEPYDFGRKPRLVWWTELDPISTVQPTEFSRPRVHAQYTQTTLDSLIHLAYRRGFIESPDYQRDYVWTLEDKQRLVRSIFNRTDIGKFVFIEYPYPENRLEIVDGKQRLRAIKDFYEGRFAYCGVTWFQLSWKDKQAFTDIMVQSVQLDATRVTKADILWLFLSLNTGGVPQTEEHIAKAQKLYAEALKVEASERKEGA